MSGRMLVTLATLVLLLIPAAAQATPLIPLQTGQWMEMDKQDNSGHTWTVRTMVFEEVTLEGNQYFRVQELYYDPYDINGGDTFSEFYMRSTNTQVFVYNGPGFGETEVFRTGMIGDFWTYQDDSGTIHKEIVAIEPITIPYGGPYIPYIAYKYIHYNVLDPSRFDYEWVVPGLGLVKEEDHWVDPSQTARIPLNSAMARAGSNPLFIPLKTGMRLIYDAGDQQNHTWKMSIEVKEQVTLDDGLTYFRMRQVNYDPIGGDVDNEFYARCDARQMFVRKLDENPAHLEYQAAGPGTAWNFPREFNGNPGTIYKQITGIQEVYVLGGSYLAYITNQSPDPGFPMTSLMSEMIAPGLGPVEMLDWWIADPNRAPLQFLLTGITQGGLNPAVHLLLLE